MANIVQIEQQLLNAARTDDMAAIGVIVMNLTNEQKAKIHPLVFGYAIGRIADYSAVDHELSTATIRKFMTAVGAYTDIESLGRAMAIIAQLNISTAQRLFLATRRSTDESHKIAQYSA